MVPDRHSGTNGVDMEARSSAKGGATEREATYQRLPGPTSAYQHLPATYRPPTEHLPGTYRAVTERLPDLVDGWGVDPSSVAVLRRVDG